MNPVEGLAEYLAQVERRLRVLALTRGAAVTALAAAAATVAAVVLANQFAFSRPSVSAARILLGAVVAFAAGFGLIGPLLQLSRRRAAREAERRFPEFEQRLLTFMETAGGDSGGFRELLATDALALTRGAEPGRVASPNAVLSFTCLAAGAAAGLFWMTTSGPGFLGYGASLLWRGAPSGGVQPYYQVVVEPGNRTVRRRADQLVTARLVGFESERVRIFARYATSSKWEDAAMRPQTGGTGYEFLFAGIPEALDYYVDAGRVRSAVFHLNVADVPTVKRIRVTYRYPAWTGMGEKVEDPGGDIRAVEGTVAAVSVQTDRPLARGVFVLDDGSRVELRDDAGWHTAEIPVSKDGLYHVAALDRGEAVRISEDYFIEAQRDRPPQVRITRPGRDARVNPIEEITIGAAGEDDFGLRELTLHYSVNGGPDKPVPLPAPKGAKAASGSAVIALEDFHLSPGDVISYYAVARGARTSTSTDILFIEAQPFEREFSQGQEGGGGGQGGGEDDPRISQRQKEIIAGTWNRIRERGRDAKGAAEDAHARFLSDVQRKLRDQAQSLARRMRSRQLNVENESFNSFADDMEKAVAAMGGAAERLRGAQWQQALGPEQQALQHLLRAEATFRQIRVAFGRRGGAGGGGGGGAGRDLQGLFDLELDTEKNQYESGRQAASADQRQREIDEALQKLDQLFRRQQDLARQPNQQASQQRWQQEMLRREAEQLQRRMEELQRQSGSSAAQAGQQGQQRAGGQGGGSAAGAQQLQQAIERLEQAARDMRQNGGAPRSDAEARRAAERLQQARDALAGLRREQAGREVDEAARQAEQIAAAQRDFDTRLRRSVGSPTLERGRPATGDRQAAERMAEEKQRLGDQVQQLERAMQQAARALQGNQPDAARKLRDALGDMQQKEIGMRMRWAAEMLRRGYGSYAAAREATVTQDLDELRDQLRDVQRAAQAGSRQGAPGDGRVDRALAQAEQLRRRMEQLGRGEAGGSKPGASGVERGGQPGARGGAVTGGAWNGGWDAINRGDLQAPAGAVPLQPATPEAVERAFNDSLRDLTRLERSIEGQADVARDVRELIREMQRIDPKRFAGNPELVERIRKEMLAGVEGVELRLRRLAEEQKGGSVRSAASERAPEGYADAVAEYYRRVAKGK